MVSMTRPGLLVIPRAPPVMCMPGGCSLGGFTAYPALDLPRLPLPSTPIAGGAPQGPRLILSCLAPGTRGAECSPMVLGRPFCSPQGLLGTFSSLRGAPASSTLLGYPYQAGPTWLLARCRGLPLPADVVGGGRCRAWVLGRRGTEDPTCPGGRGSWPGTGAGPDSVELSFAWRAAGSERLSLPKVAAICTAIKSPEDDK